MPEIFFVSDLHGSVSRYEKLLNKIRTEKPDAVLFGGDLLPHGFQMSSDIDDFTMDYIIPSFTALKEEMNDDYPEVMIILGNDDPRAEEKKFQSAAESSIWHYLHFQHKDFFGYRFYGYSYVPPTPFMLKDWERYDVSRYVDPGCVHPTEGFRSVEPDVDVEYESIQKDLEKLAGKDDLSKAVFLFHSPPYKTNLDKTGLEGKMIDHVPLDPFVGSIAMRRFIEERQPLLTLHGHIHESSNRTGNWKDAIGNTTMLSAAYHEKELALVRLNLDDPATAVREII